MSTEKHGECRAKRSKGKFDASSGKISRIRSLEFVSKDGGITLLRIIEAISPGSVEWGKVEHKLKSPFQRGINYNLIVKTVQKEPFALGLQNIGGEDLDKGNMKLTISCVRIYLFACALKKLKFNFNDKH